MNEMGNPFEETSQDLIVLESKDIIDPSVVETVWNIEKVEREQYNTFVKERLEKRTTSLAEPIKKNKLPFFSCPRPKDKSKEKQMIAYLKQDCSLFSRLYISCQVRDGNLDKFFAPENQGFPPLSHLYKSCIKQNQLCPSSSTD